MLKITNVKTSQFYFIVRMICLNREEEMDDITIDKIECNISSIVFHSY